MEEKKDYNQDFPSGRDQAAYEWRGTPVSGRVGRRLSARTFLAPLLFMVLHHLLLNLASLVYLFFYMKGRAALGGGIPYDPSDSASLIELLVEGNVMTYASLIAMVILIPSYLTYLHVRKKRQVGLLSCRRVTGLQAVSSIATILGALGLTQLWISILASLEPTSLPGRLFQEYSEKMVLFDGRTATLALEFLVTVLLVPIGEELLFRGIVQGELGRSFSPRVTVAATTLLFAIFHLDLIQASYVLIAGFVLSYVYQLTRNILVPIVLHVIFNFIGSGWILRLAKADEFTERLFVYTLYSFILLGAAGLYILNHNRYKEEGVAG